VSIDGHPKHGFTTGVSARERARTIKMAIDTATGPGDFVRPGHINPLRSREGGVLVRTGQTEGSVDLCRLAGLYPAAIIIEIMRDDGEMARMPDLEVLAAKHNIKICTVEQIIEHRLERETLVRRIEPFGGTPIKTEFGEFNLIALRAQVDPLPHIALCVGGVGRLDGHGHVIETDEPTLVRMHRRHLLGDVFHDVRSSPEGATAHTLHESMRMIQAAGRGAIVYLRPEGLPGSDAGQMPSLEQRLQTIVKHEVTPDTPSRTVIHSGLANVPSMRDYGIGVQILRQLGLRTIELISNHKRGLPGLDAFGLRISRYVKPQI
jgi:3,4-dihydroxy 2-butanone 4-phosphate synthase/GTP cyclohydrolase II